MMSLYKVLLTIQNCISSGHLKELSIVAVNYPLFCRMYSLNEGHPIFFFKGFIKHMCMKFYELLSLFKYLLRVHETVVRQGQGGDNLSAISASLFKTRYTCT